MSNTADEQESHMATAQSQILIKERRFLLLVLMCAVQQSRAFNVDVRFPVVKEGKTKGSLFGLSVAIHRQTVGEDRYLLLVGAPKERAEAKLWANETGDMYACPISMNPSDCMRMNLVSSDDPVEENDRLEGMWLGVSVASQSQPGGRVLACGHRYVRILDAGTNWRMIGRCYIRGNDLSYNPTRDYQWQANYEVCDPTGNEVMEGMCTMGISATFTQTEVIVGAPSCFNWQGNAYAVWRNPEDEYDARRAKFPDLKRGNIYMGYSVVKERGLLSRDKDTIVTGAPRDKAKGSVVLATQIDFEELKQKLVIEGQQVGSYFGNSLAVVDLNNDGWNDIVVGAPFYFDRKREEGGAVYIFLNRNGSFRNESDLVLRGPRDSAFGMAVAAIGDVNQDGFQDFAVGAPYVESGHVSIFMGSQGGLPSKPSQVIKGKDIPGGMFQTFGYSISGGIDVDNNRYPDLVVGSLDDRVALLRARPVIHLKKSFSVTPQIVNPNECDACIQVQVCFSYTISTGDTSFRENIKLKYTIEADQLQRSAHGRVLFLSNDKETYTRHLSMPSEECHTLKLGLVKPIRNKVAPITFSLNVTLVEPAARARRDLQSLGAFPVMSGGEVVTEKKEIHFQKACGQDNKCESNLQMAAQFTNEQRVPFPLQNGHPVFQYSANIKKLLLDVNVTNIPSKGKKAEDAHNAMLNITVPPSLQYAGFRSVTSTCTSENPFVLCELGNPFVSDESVQIFIIFETSGISLDTQDIHSLLQLSTLSEQSDLQPLSLVLLVEYTLKTSFLLVQQRSQTYFSGEIIGESAMNSTNDIGSPVEFTYQVDIQGKPLGILGTLVVVFDWPVEVASGKWLLYISEIQMTGTSDSLCIPSGNIVNPLKLKVSEHKSGRTKREESSLDAEHAIPQASLKTRDIRQRAVLLNCSTGGARCQRFSCPLQNMNNSASISIRARLWNGTMMEDYMDAWRITVIGKATLNLITEKPTIRMNNETREFHLEIEPAFTVEVPSDAPLWIVIVSVLAGVLLLGLIIILLWKCGFFRRASTRELYEAKVQKAEMKTQPSENDRLTEED